jgi:hypothetical protein
MLKAWGPELFCAAMIWILTKQATSVPGVETSRIVPFRWNRVQRKLYRRAGRNNRVVKARQGGFTTWMLIYRLFIPVVTEGGKAGLLISQDSKYATQHFLIARRALRLFGAGDPYDNSQNALCVSMRNNLLHTQYANRRELFFDYLDSKIVVESAEVGEAGQGLTLHHVVASEIARWPGVPEDTVSNIKGGLVAGGTFDEESTANGAAGYYYEQVLRSIDNPAAADAVLHFFPWYETEEYAGGTVLTLKEREELRADLQSDELQLIARMHKELDCVVG